MLPLNPTPGTRYRNFTWDGRNWVCGPAQPQPPQPGPPCGCSGGGPQLYQGLRDGSPPGELWNGPYPIAVGSVSPSQVKVWFNTVTNTLLAWHYQTQSWNPVASTVTVNTTVPLPTNPFGTLWLDATQKLWCSVDDNAELTEPIAGGPTVLNGATFTASIDPPQNPTSGNVWFEPQQQDLNVWNGFAWVHIGQKVYRDVRIGHPLGTWNAGGNRTQAVRAGDVLWVAGMRGIDPLTQQQVPGPGVNGTTGTVPPNTASDGGLARFTQVYNNIMTVVQNEGLTLFDCFHLFSTSTWHGYTGPLQVAQTQPQFWGNGPYPGRTVSIIVAMGGSDPEVEYPGLAGVPSAGRGDILEVQATFFTGRAGRRRPSGLANELLEMSGASMGEGFPPM
jgi:hypothetical protein